MQHGALVASASVHSDLDATLSDGRDGTVIAQGYHDWGGEGVELVKPVAIRAHDPGCTGIDEPFFREVDVLDAGFRRVGIDLVRGR